MVKAKIIGLNLAFLWLVFRKKELYLVITQKLSFMKSSWFHVDFTWNPPKTL